MKVGADMKKALSLFLGLVLTFLIFTSSVPVAFAAQYSGECGTGMTWSLDTFTGVLSINGNGDMKDYSADSLPGWSAYQGYVKTVTLEQGVTSVGDYAFYNQTGYRYSRLSTLNFSSTVSNIGKYAFRGCKNIKNINSFDAKTIEDYAFRSCEGLEAFDLGTKIATIGNGAFSFCSALSSISFPSTLKTVENSAFESTGLTELTIPSNVTSIGSNAFADCVSLRSVTYSASSITACENGLFYGSGAADGMSVTFSSNVTAVPSDIFNNCINLTDVTLSDSIITIGDNAFKGSGLKAIHFPKNVKNLGKDAFSACNSLTGFTVDSSNLYYSSGDNGELTNRSKSVIYRYPSGRGATSYTLLSSILTIQKGAFSGDTHLKSINTNNATAMYADAFQQCRELTSVSMPKITTVKTYAFADCDKLTTVTAPKVTLIEGCGFFGCDSLANLNGFTALKTINEYAFAGCDGFTELVLPSTVTTVGTFAFTNCDNMKTLEIPSSVTTVNESAFASNDELVTLTLNEGLKTIGKNAFVNCPKLKSVTIPKSVTSITSKSIGYTMSASGAYTAISGFTVRYYSGSTGNTYANNNTSLGSEVITTGDEEAIPPENETPDFVPATPVELPMIFKILKIIVNFVTDIIKAVV